jgi:hypothetical protein
MRPPESATQCDLPARFAASIWSNHSLAAARASASALPKEASSKFCMTGSYHQKMLNSKKSGGKPCRQGRVDMENWLR